MTLVDHSSFLASQSEVFSQSGTFSQSGAFSQSKAASDESIAPVSILFVDDEPAILAAIKRLTRKIPAHFEFVTSPLQALALIAQKSIDIIVSDMRMPEMDGVTFLSEVATNYPETIRIMLTGNADSDLVMSAINKGRIWSFIEKPWDSEQLVLTLQQAIQTRNLMRTRVNHLYRELEQAKLAADSGSQEKSNFLAVMSHEIRTPMNALLGSMELLTSTQLDDQQRQLLSNALTAGESLSTLVNDILDFSKIEAGKLQLSPQVFNTLDLMDDLHSLFIERAKAKNIGLMFCLSPQLSRQLLLDKQRVKQILINLIANAIKFTQHGGVEVSVYGNDSVLHFEVKDTGIGIKNDDIPKLFNKFVQADSSYKRQFEGTGLGLAITKQLTELMGGEVRVGSKEGQGSTFLVAIPHQHFTDPIVASESLTVNKIACVNFAPFYETSIKKQLHLWQCQVDFMRDSSNACQMVNLSNEGLANQVLMFREEENRWLAPPSELMALVLSHREEVNQRLDNAMQENSQQESSSQESSSQENSQQESSPQESSTQENSQGKKSKTQQANLNGNGERILVVEDSLPNQLVIRTMLERAGYDIDIADNGAQAVKQVERENYQLVLMDLSMPVMDGAQACRIIRSKSNKFKSLPIWAMTANVTKDDMQHCFAAGMNEFIEKPIDREQLLLKIYSFFEQVRQQQASLAISSPKNMVRLDKGNFIEGGTRAKLVCDTLVYETTSSGNLIEKAVTDQLLKDTGEEVFSKVLHLFVEETRRRIDVIQQAQIEADASQIEKEAHAIKSSAASVGAISLGQQAKQLEHICQGQPSDGGLPDAAIELAQQLTVLAEQVLTAFEQDYLAKL